MQVPATTVEFLDALKARKGWTSDYQLWKALGWKQTTVSSYRNGRAAIAGKHAIRIADELGLPRAYVLACAEAERENNADVAGIWREIANRFRGAAAIILIALVGLSAYRDAQAAPGLERDVGRVRSVYPCIDYAKRLARLAARILAGSGPVIA